MDETPSPLERTVSLSLKVTPEFTLDGAGGAVVTSWSDLAAAVQTAMRSSPTARVLVSLSDGCRGAQAMTDSEMPSDDSNTTPKKLRVSFSAEAENAVDEIMRLGAYSSRQEAIRHALGTELFLQKRRREGWSVLLRKGAKDGKGAKYEELEWPDA